MSVQSVVVISSEDLMDDPPCCKPCREFGAGHHHRYSISVFVAPEAIERTRAGLDQSIVSKFGEVVVERHACPRIKPVAIDRRIPSGVRLKR